MKEKEFIIDIVKNLVKVFPSTKVRYENHLLSNTHFIEVVPSDFYKLNEEFLKWEEEAIFNFINQFPDQNISFISDDDIVGVENIDYEIKGELYDLLHSYNNQNYNDIEVVLLNNSNLDNSLASINNIDTRVLLNDIYDYSFNFSRQNLDKTLVSFKDLVSDKQTVHNPTNIQYALAA